MQEAASKIEDAGRRSWAIERKLDVQQISVTKTRDVLLLEGNGGAVRTLRVRRGSRGRRRLGDLVRFRMHPRRTSTRIPAKARAGAKGAVNPNDLDPGISDAVVLPNYMRGQSTFS